MWQSRFLDGFWGLVEVAAPVIPHSMCFTEAIFGAKMAQGVYRAQVSRSSGGERCQPSPTDGVPAGPAGRQFA